MGRHPTLSDDNITDDEQLDTFIGAAVDTPDAARHSRRIRHLQTALRRQLTKEQWRAYLAIEETVNERVVEESRTIATAAWREGRRRGRAERRR